MSATSELAASLYDVFQADAWDDIVMTAAVIPTHGNQGDPDYDTDGTLLFDAAASEQVAFIYQMPHAWASTPVRFHVHWSKSSNAAGDVIWQYRYRLLDEDDVPPSWSDWIGRSDRVGTLSSDQRIMIDMFPLLTVSDLDASSIISVQLRRYAESTSDTYAADARLWSADLHFKRYGLGSSNEW